MPFGSLIDLWRFTHCQNKETLNSGYQAEKAKEPVPKAAMTFCSDIFFLEDLLSVSEPDLLW